MPKGLAAVVKVLPSKIIKMSFHFKKLSLILGFFAVFTSLKSQVTYRYNSSVDPAFTIGSGLLFTASIIAQKQVKPLSDQVILSLNSENINQFDRIACTQWSPKTAKLSDGLVIGTGLLYSYYLFKPQTRKASVNIAGVAFQSLLLAQALSNALKLSCRNRPFLYNPSVSMDEKRKIDSRMSFFSAHTTTVSSLCFSFALAHKVYCPNQKQTGIWIGAFTIPAIEGFLRVKAGKHYPSDVITGYLVGLGSSLLMHYLHKQ